MPNQEEQLRYYDDSTNDYESPVRGIPRAPNRAFMRKSATINRALRGQHHPRVLEVGAGSGLLSLFATQVISYQKYVVSDLSRNMLDRAQTLMSCSMPDLEKISFEVVDLYAISAVSDNYDLIIGTDIIHHLDDPEKVLRELRSKVNPGGKLVILETNIRNPLTWVNVIGREHEMRAVLNTRENLLSWLEGAGWQNASVVPGPAFTPAGPKWAHPALTVIDHVAVRIPKLNQIAAFWTLFGEQHE